MKGEADGDRALAAALALAADAWDLAVRERPADHMLRIVATAAAVIERATSAADEALLLRIWTMACGTPVATTRPYTREARGRLMRLESGEALEALGRASDLLVEDAQRHPFDPVVGLAATVVAAMTSAIRREDRTLLATLREYLADPTPVVEMLRARDLPIKAWQRDDLDGDAALRSTIAASEAWRRAASAPWATGTTRAAAPIISAINAAILRTDEKALGELAEWAHRYTEYDVALPSHSRAVRATHLVDRLARLLDEHDRGDAEEGTPSWWPGYITAVVHEVALLMPECFPNRLDPVAVVPSMRARLEEPRESGRLLHMLREQGADRFVRAIAVSTLKANVHTARFAENLFTFERARTKRRQAE
jgi:hypothetical protein